MEPPYSFASPTEAVPLQLSRKLRKASAKLTAHRAVLIHNSALAAELAPRGATLRGSASLLTASLTRCKHLREFLVIRQSSALDARQDLACSGADRIGE